MNNLSSPSPNPVLVRALRHVLSPLVRLMLASGISYPLVAEVLKSVFVETADRHFRLGRRRPTDSRVTVLTGVHRKDVRRLRARDDPERVDEIRALPFSARLVAAWLGNPRFLDEAGQPLTLRRTGNGSDPSFDELVSSHSTDCRPRVVLDEWLRQGLVEINSQDRIALRADAFIPSQGLDEKLHYFARHLHDHVAAATDNLLGERPPQLERSVSYEGLSEASVRELERRARQLSTRMINEINRLAIALDAHDSANVAPRQRFTFGAYFYSEAEEPADQPSG